MKRIALSTLFIFTCIITASAQTTPQQAVVAAGKRSGQHVQTQPKRLATLRAADAPEGSRVIVTSDATLSDYQAYVDGGRFYVLIPNALSRKRRLTCAVEDSRT